MDRLILEELVRIGFLFLIVGTVILAASTPILAYMVFFNRPVNLKFLFTGISLYAIGAVLLGIAVFVGGWAIVDA